MSAKARHILSTTNYRIRLFSSVVVFIMANMLQYSTYDIQQMEIMNHSTMFMIWSYASMIKFLGVHAVLRFSPRWVSLLKAMRMTIPMLSDLLTQFFIIILVFCQIGSYLYGGTINESTKDIFKEMTDNDLDDKMLL